MISWGQRRKFIVETGAALGVLFIIVLVVFVTMYRAPSCTDKKQDQRETGVDCGGPCPNACSADEAPPSVRFARAVSPSAGRTDIIAYIDNPNSNAGAVRARVTVDLYAAKGKLIESRIEYVTLPPSTTVPLFIPNFYSGKQHAVQAFVTFNSTDLKWLYAVQKPINPIPSNIEVQDSATPKITATLTNPSAQELDTVTVIATIFDAQDNAIAASQTVVPQLLGQGTAPVIFTWNTPFTSAPERIEILPVPASPS